MHMIIIEKPTHGTYDWLKIRHRDEHGLCTLGGSEAPALMDSSAFMSQADLWYRKSTEPTISEPSAAMQVGNDLEPALVDVQSRTLGIEMITPDIMYRSGRWTVTLDAVDAQSVASGAAPSIIGEIKTTRKYSISSLSDVPPEYLWQIYAQQYVTGAEAWLTVLDRDLRITTLAVPRNERAMEVLAEQAEKFCASVDAGIQPDGMIDKMSADQIASLWRTERRAIALPADAIDWVRDLEEARALKKQAETIEQAAKDHLARLLLDADEGQIDGQTVITWREQAGRESVDIKTLRIDQPDLIAKYTTTGNPVRVMRTAKAKGK
jgi:predicted phage-related endonuclease